VLYIVPSKEGASVGAGLSAVQPVEAP